MTRREALCSEAVTVTLQRNDGREKEHTTAGVVTSESSTAAKLGVMQLSLATPREDRTGISGPPPTR